MAGPKDVKMLFENKISGCMEVVLVDKIMHPEVNYDNPMKLPSTKLQGV